MFASVSSVGRTRAVDYLSLRRHCAVSAKVAATAATAVAASLAQENTHTNRHSQAHTGTSTVTEIWHTQNQNCVGFKALSIRASQAGIAGREEEKA